MLNKNAQRMFAWIVTCTVAIASTAGCRSMAGRNMFGFRSEPSAEALAGAGPTTTYPAPPSASATPEAIASVAGGTAPAQPATSAPTTAQVAGVDILPGYATPAVSESPTNMAAAQANGIFRGSSNANPSGFQPPASPSPSGYTFGSKAFTPKADSSNAGSSFAVTDPSASSKPINGLTVPSTSSPAIAESNYTKPPAVPSGSGFTLPTDSTALAALTPPSTAASDPPQAPAEVSPIAASAPSFSTASAAPMTAPGNSGIGSPGIGSPGIGSASAAGSYMPGSTGTASGYPVGNDTPATQGSFYR